MHNRSAYQVARFRSYTERDNHRPNAIVMESTSDKVAILDAPLCASKRAPKAPNTQHSLMLLLGTRYIPSHPYGRCSTVQHVTPNFTPTLNGHLSKVVTRFNALTRVGSHSCSIPRRLYSSKGPRYSPHMLITPTTPLARMASTCPRNPTGAAPKYTVSARRQHRRKRIEESGQTETNVLK